MIKAGERGLIRGQVGFLILYPRISGNYPPVTDTAGLGHGLLQGQILSLENLRSDIARQRVCLLHWAHFKGKRMKKGPGYTFLSKFTSLGHFSSMGGVSR